MSNRKKYLLFSQNYRKSNKIAYAKGVLISELIKLKKNCSRSVRRTAEKIPAYIRYIEKEHGIVVMESTKRKTNYYKTKTSKFYTNDLDFAIA
jgi:hypothetical protein